MSSAVPLNNAVAQNSVDFNNLTPTNAGGLFRYKINSYSSKTHTLTTSDANAVCIFTGGDTVVSLDNTNFSDLAIGTEIIYYGTSGFVRIYATGALLGYSRGVFTAGINSVSKLIYTGGGKWYIAGFNMAPASFSWSDCCGLNASIYQLTSSNTFDPGLKSYLDSTLTIPFNGIYYDESTLNYYSIVNGTNVGVSSCGTEDFGTAYTFYTGPNSPTDEVYFYSVSGLIPSDYPGLLGKKFFTAGVGEQFPCYLTDRVSPDAVTTYYGSPAQYPNNGIRIKDGYVIEIINP